MKRLLHIAGIAVLAFTMLGADNSTTRLDRIGHKLVCQCGCGQILSECNHVGCPVSPVMLGELRTRLDAGLTEKPILDFFIGKYGPIALAAPIRGGFDNVAWIVPIAAALLCLATIFWLLQTWKRRSSTAVAAAAPAPTTPADESLRARIRRETDDTDWSDPR